ncbi:hypothetical protein ACFE04_023790 [Oxalis oulophora]
MGDLVGGALLGTAFGILSDAIVDAVKTVSSFNSNFKNMKNILKQIQPIIEEIVKLNVALGISEDETSGFAKSLKEGAKIVRKCAKVGKCNLVKRYKYSTKLKDLETLLNSMFTVVMQAQAARDIKGTRIEVRELTAEFRRFSKKGSCGSGNGSGRGVGSSVVPGPSLVPHVGLDVPLMELKNDLLKNDAQVIALTAPGGCGKTTLVKSLCADKDVKEKFREENIIFITVSKTGNLEDIVRRIFHNYDDEAPDFSNDEYAIHQVEALLRDRGPNPILLVLDDIWSGTESLIEKLMFPLQNYKILVSSRFEFPRFGIPHRLATLNHEDAMSLFRHFAKNADVQDQKIVKKIVECCKGLPLALKVVGGSLSGQPPSIWKAKEMEFSEGATVLESNDEVLDCVKKTYDGLDSKLKEFYMDLGSFPEDQKIPVTSLVDMWVERYNLDEHGVRAITNLHQLSYRNLLNLDVTRKFTQKDASEVDSSYKEWFAGEVDDFYNEHFVTLHDILRDLVIYDYQNHGTSECVENRRRLFVDASGNKFPNWWQNPQHISARLLSITTGESFTSTWCDLQPPEVETLILNFRSKKYDLPEFIQKMKKLQVLIITNYGFFHGDLGSFSLLDSLSNLKRLRLEKVLITSLDIPTLPLINLRKLSLVMCKNIQALCYDSVKLSDVMPNLVDINIDYCDDLLNLPNGISDIVLLKKLSVTNCHALSALPDDIGKLVNLEVLRLSKCTGLSELPDAITCLSKLSFLDISDCLISNLPSEFGQLQSLRKFSMRGCLNLNMCCLPISIMNMTQLEEVRCDEGAAILYEDFRMYLDNLKVVVLKEELNLNWL